MKGTFGPSTLDFRFYVQRGVVAGQPGTFELEQTPQQSTGAMHGWHFAPQETAASTAVGAVIEITIGSVMAAPRPMRRTASRRDMFANPGSAADQDVLSFSSVDCSKRCERRSWSKASQTI